MTASSPAALLVMDGSASPTDWFSSAGSMRESLGRIPARARRRCTVAVHDMLGRQVAVLAADADLGPGRITLAWDADGAASGIYYVTLRAAGIVTTRPLLLLR